jgi:chemotaxis protein CheX
LIIGAILQAQIDTPDLAAIVEGAVTAMLGIDLGEPVEHDTAAAGCSLCASVQFAGGWEGAVVVGSDIAFGRETAAAMFDIEADDVTDDEIADALGELANMIGGNVRPLLPGAETLSLPTVVRGDDIKLGIPGARVWVAIVYRRDGSEVSVQIYERAQ